MCHFSDVKSSLKPGLIRLICPHAKAMAAKLSGWVWMVGVVADS